MRFIELFAGIGGFRLGLERTGHKCVWASEWLESPRRIYARNFGDVPDSRDIYTVDASTLPKAELVVGGFPCFAFSIAGKRKGFNSEDARGTLFFEICRILRVTRTPYVFLENVKGLLNHDDGRSFGVILAALDELGYDVQWQCCNSKNYGVPQNRERVFIIGNLREHPRPNVFPIGGKVDEDRKVEEPTEPTFSCLTARGAGEYHSGMQLIERVVSTSEDNGTNRSEEGNESKRSGVGLENEPYIHMLSHTKANMKERNKKSDYVWTLDTRPQHKIGISLDGRKIRRITPLECERAQGLPDNFTKYYDDGSLVSDTERYERCGRTVSTPVIEEIGKRLHV